MSIQYQSSLKILTNTLITEYDIRKANVSIMEAYHLAPPEVIAKIRALPREERQRKVGLMERDDRHFKDALENAFTDIIQRFLKANELDIDVDVTDIRRDAVFVVAKPVNVTTFSNSIVFRPKETFHAMVKIGNFGFFFRTTDSRKDHVAVDGFIGSNKPQEVLERLKPGMISFLEEFVEVTERSNGDKRKVYTWMKVFCRMYKARELDAEYYREFNRDASFRVPTGSGFSLFNFISDDQIDQIDISFNYMNIIVPLLQIIV